MFKKFLCLSAAIVMVAACDPQENNNGQGSINGNGTTLGSEAPGTERDFVINVGDRVFFGYDRSDLTAEARATLDRQAAWLKKYPNHSLTVEGHCDERGTREYNLALGERRAQSMKNYLVAAGVDASSLQTISYGKERPAVVGSNEASWAQNRRGVAVLKGQ